MRTLNYNPMSGSVQVVDDKRVAIKDVKPGDYVRLAPGVNAPVWIRGDYDRASKTYTLESWGDIGRTVQRKGVVLVWVDFEF